MVDGLDTWNVKMILNRSYTEQQWRQMELYGQYIQEKHGGMVLNSIWKVLLCNKVQNTWKRRIKGATS